MAIFNVFLDSNIFINAKYDFKRGSLYNLKRYCDDGISKMFTNDIIIREIKHHLKTDVGLLAAQAKNEIKKHAELKNAITIPVFEEISNTLLDAPRQLSGMFNSYMEDAVELSNTGLSIVDLFDDYFESRAPFEIRQEKKSEFPDAAVIMSIKQYLASTKDASLYVVTDDDGWHNALFDIPGVFLYRKLKDLLSKISKEQESAMYEAIFSSVDEKITSLENYAKDWLRNQEWKFLVDENVTRLQCDEVDEVDVREVRLELDGIDYIDMEERIAIASLIGMSKVKIRFSYIDHIEAVYDKEEHVWLNTAYGDGIVKLEVPINLMVLVMLPDENNGKFDFNSPDFEDLDKEFIEIIDYELTERKDDIRDPHYTMCPDCGEKIGFHNDGGNGFCTDCSPKH